MAFFNKKQDVLDIELTSYGKQLLSRGLFNPVYYAFSDDGILYDQKWMSGSTSTEAQSDVEFRIQEETPRPKPQNRRTGSERAIFNHLTYNPNYVKTLLDIFEFANVEELWDQSIKLNLNVNFAESEKMLENTLGVKSYFNNYNPAWNLLLYHGEIKTTTAFYQKNDITTIVPQVNIALNDTVYKMDASYKDPLATLALSGEATEIMYTYNDVANATSNSIFSVSTQDTLESLFFKEFSTDEGNIFVIKDFVFLSLEEQNVDFTKDNFFIEVFEVTTTSDENDGEEQLIKMVLDKDLQGALLSASTVFDIQVDDEINPHIACSLISKDKVLKDQSVYITNIFNCDDLPAGPGINIDPYTNLPDVDVGDTC